MVAFIRTVEFSVTVGDWQAKIIDPMMPLVNSTDPFNRHAPLRRNAVLLVAAQCTAMR
jgi:hypothetical protein